MTRLRDDLCLRGGLKALEANQDHAGSGAIEAKDQFTKVLINGDQDGLPVIRLLEYLIIADTWRKFRDIDNIMPVVAQLCDNLAINAFISNEIHAALSVTG